MTDRFLTPLREMIRAEISRLSYLATWEYSVNGVNGDKTVNCESPSAPLPTLNNVPVYAGPEGGTSTPTVGQKCYVRFINADPTRPVVVGNQALVKDVTIDATDTVAVGASANEVVIAGGVAPAARMGDALQIYFPTGPMPCAGIVGAVPGTFAGTVTFALPGTGVIMSGQPKVLQ